MFKSLYFWLISAFYRFEGIFFLWYNSFRIEKQVVQYSSQNCFSEGGAKNPSRAHRWSSWCWLPTPSRGLVLGVREMGRSAMACRRWPYSRGDPSSWCKRISL